MRSSLALGVLPVLVVLAAPAVAQRTVPANAAMTEGNSSSYMPFIYDKGKFQQIVDGASFCKVSAVLREIAMRRDGTRRGTFVGRTITNYRVNIGHSKHTAATMSNTFGSNWASAKTQIFSGTYNLPTNPPVQGLGPWNIQFKIKKPFVYLRSRGNLIIEWETPGNAQRKAEYLVDSHRAGGAGRYTVFGTGGQFKTNDRHALFSNAASLKPGGSADLRVTGLLNNYPAIATYGFSNTRYGALRLPFDLNALGAAGNHLYVSIDLALGLPLSKLGGFWNGTLRLPIPNQAALGGLTLYGQAIYVDAASNALGLVFSRAVAMNIAFTGSGPSQIMGTPRSTATTGNFLTRTGTDAPILRLTGGFN